MDERLGRRRSRRKKEISVESTYSGDLILIDQYATPEEKTFLQWSSDSLGHGRRLRRTIKKIKERLATINR